MYAYGAPTHTLENDIASLAAALQLELTAAVLPGLIIIAFSEALMHTSETYVMRQSSNYESNRLNRVFFLLLLPSHLNEDRFTHEWIHQ